MIAADPDRYYYADQYSNDENWRAHYRTTGNEIWEQTEGQVTHFVAALGTSGTFMGTTRRLKELNPAIQCVSMQPDSPFNGLEGLKHMATAIVPKIYDPNLADQNIEMATERAYEMVKRLGRDMGILVGVSAGEQRPQQPCNSPNRPRYRGREAVIVTHPVRRRGKIYERTLLAGGLTYAEAKLLRLQSIARAWGGDLPALSAAEFCWGTAVPDGNHVRETVRAGNTRTDSAHNRYNIAPEGAGEDPAPGS